MLRNFLLSSIDNLKATKWSYLANLLGLAIAFAFFILAMAYVHYETHYDHWVPDHERIYRVAREVVGIDEGVKKESVTTVALHDYLKSHNPEVLDATWLEVHSERNPLLTKRGLFKSVWVRAPENIAHFWGLTIIEGRSQCPKKVSCALISASLAQKIFGDAPVIGEQMGPMMLGASTTEAPTIIGVYQDIQENSHLAFGFVYMEKNANSAADTSRESISKPVYTYVKLKNNAGQKEGVFNGARKHIVEVLRQYFEQWNWVEPRRYFLEPLGELYLATDIAKEISPMKPKGNKQQVRLVAGAALLLILIAALNFSGLLLTRNFRRLREMALRKLFGSSNQYLLVLTTVDIAVFVLLAVSLGLLFAHLLAPVVMPLFGIEFSLVVVLTGGLYLWLVGVSIGLILFAFIMPAWSIQHLKPADVFSGVVGNLSSSKGFLFSFVVLQFVIAQLVVLGAVTAGLQYKQAAEKTFAANIDNTLSIPIAPLQNLNYFKNSVAFAQAVAQGSYINGWTISSVIPAGDISIASEADDELIEKYYANKEILVHQVDGNYFDFFQIRFLAGRSFSEKAGDFEASSKILKITNDFNEKRELLIRRYNGKIPDSVYEEEIGQPPFLKNGKYMDYSNGLTIPIVLNIQAVKKLGFLSEFDALGKIVAINKILGFGSLRPSNESGYAQVIGVVPNLDHRWKPGAAQLPAVYFPAPLPFVNDGGMISFKVSNLDRDNLHAHIQRSFEKNLKSKDPILELKYSWLETKLLDTLRPGKRRMQVFMLMAGLVIIISMLGLHYAVQFTAREMRREMTIRKVFGSSTKVVVQRVIWTFTKPVLVASLIAWPIGYYLINQWLLQYSEKISIGPGIFISASLISFLTMLVVVTGEAYRIATSSPANDLAGD